MHSQDRDEDGFSRARMDFTMEVIRADDATRIVEFRIIPDPRRYDQIEQDGVSYFFDKYLKHLIPEDLIMGKAAEQLKGLPIYHLSSSIKSAPQYAAARKIALGSELRDGNYIAPTEKAAPHRDFDSGTTKKWLVFLSIDICGGTALRRSNPDAFERAYRIFLRELGTVVGQFNGTILKTTGDGFIAYIDYPAFTQQADNAIDMGLSCLAVLRNSINPVLLEAGFPALKIRIGGDYGDAQVRLVEVPSTGFSSTEIASDALNRAVKIEQTSQENEFRIGRNLYELLHVQWLERGEEVAFDGNSIGIADYKTYRIE